jgi:YHS domain-containing protein
MVTCDCCGKRVDERSMDSITGQNGKTYFVCQACRGYYDDQELLDKCEEQASLEL